ncbi:MAG: bifunctional phosphoribosylaminoimidazolecarboxamide formyltransferase/IMP cyclohydrolase [Planctomycetota bacterium]|nr:bifunctional phosphoribosylaminoimidazolecarboxamide formyltransferase/IMP cyclohydrolase [Planctomycetota bacterium]
MRLPIRRALLSVSDKAGLVPFAAALARRQIEIISTGGTAAALRAAGIQVTTIDALTGFPEILDGRVKTLHPAVHAGLLAVRDSAAHAAQLEQHAIGTIDLVCVNLYPFEQTVARPDVTRAEAIEQIDIGGPSMIRSAAKNHAFVTVVTAPAQYDRVLHELDLHNGETTPALRAELAREAFALTSRYDAAIAAYLTDAGDARFPPLLTLTCVKVDDLRYGENPHQAAALYRRVGRAPAGTVPLAEQLHGKELSYNNLNDAHAALSLARALASLDPARAAAAIIKHANPCGAALANDARTAIDQAIAGDPIAAYGGILALSAPLDADAADRLNTKDVFLEVVLAPDYDADALATLRARSANLRILRVGPEVGPPEPLELRSIPGGLLVQERDLRLAHADEYVRRAGPAPTPEALDLARFLECVARALVSNAVCIGARGESGAAMLVGAGAGQMDRVTACRLAVEKAGRHASGAVAFSDAFFPFPDGPEILIDAGVRTIVHPGGSKRDDETFALCEARGVTCLTTGLRHFRH